MAAARLRARAVTKAEIREADRPWPYYFGYDYAVVLRCDIALYFYMKFVAMKYNLVYVHPKSAGRGHVARSAYTIIFICLVLLEFTVAVVILEVGRKEQFAAMVFLMGATIQRRQQAEGASKARDRVKILKHHADDVQKREAFARLVASTIARRQQDEQRAYVNPYDAGLKVFNCIYTQQKTVCDDVRDKAAAFAKLKQVTAHSHEFLAKPNE
ncbi:hypothetical protein B5M09_012428 [Aphanomyces astaci]|uniref:Uncharacterized protein n=1 Tax=Aphanomyces astaci TaxID=112090 RepID=A0A425DL19_APHAT|nr:hypothetical protein B5M09_012428 [Aphanomyces astaci]